MATLPAVSPEIVCRFYSAIGTSVLATTVAVVSYPSVITALVPGMKIHGQTNTPSTTANGVLFLPVTRTTPFNGTCVPSLSMSDFKSILKRPFVPATEDFWAVETIPSARVPAGINTMPPDFTSCVTLNLTLSPISTSRAYTVLMACRFTTVPAFITAVCT